MFEKRVVNIDDRDYDLRVHFERRNSARASITRRGINIRVPSHLSNFRREIEVEKMLNWARERIIENPPSPIFTKEYSNGSFIKTNHKIYRLNLEFRDSQKNFAKVEGSYINFKISNLHSKDKVQNYLSKQLQKILAKEHLDDLKNRVNHLNRIHFNKEIKKISWRYTKSRWGACKSNSKEIELSTKLLLAPLEVLDYVIIHELAHLIQPNHSSAFWDLVRKADPNYKLKTKWLKENGHKLVI